MDEIIGYRAWEERTSFKDARRFFGLTFFDYGKIRPEDVEIGLSSLNQTILWLPNQKTQCYCALTHKHRTHKRKFLKFPFDLEEKSEPFFNCSCGVYAYRELSRLQAEFKPQQYRLLGEVSLWGKIIEHEDGFRAQFAYPRRFFYSEFEVKTKDKTKTNKVSNEELARKYANIFGVEVSRL